MSLASFPSSSATTHETLDAWTYDVFARFDGARAAHALAVDEHVQAVGRDWLADYMASVLVQGLRPNIADLIKTPGRTTAKKTRAGATAAKDKADKVKGLNARFGMSPLLSPGPGTKGKGKEKAAAPPASPPKKPGKKRGRPKKAATATDAPAGDAHGAVAEDADTQSAPTRGKKAAAVERSAPARLERKAAVKTPRAEEEIDVEIDEPVVELEAEVAELIEVDEVKAVPAATHGTVAADDRAPVERPANVASTSTRAADHARAKSAAISLVSDDSDDDGDADMHDDHEEPLHDASDDDDDAAPAAPAQPLRQVRSSWLSKALINGAVAPSEMARKSTAPGDYRKSTVSSDFRKSTVSSDMRKSTAPSEFAKSTATTASAASSAPSAAGADRKSVVPAFALRKSLVPVGGLKRKSEAGDDADARPDKAVKLQAAQPTSVPAKPAPPPVFSRTNSGPADAPPSAAADAADARDRHRSDIHKVTRALEEMRERAAAKQKTEPAPTAVVSAAAAAAAAAGPPKQSTSTGTGFLRGLASVGRSLLGSKSEEEDVRRAEREAEEDRRAQEEAEAELARLMREMEDEKAGGELKGAAKDDGSATQASKRSTTPPLAPSTAAAELVVPAAPQMDVEPTPAPVAEADEADEADEDLVNESIGAISLPSLPQPELHDDDASGPGPDHDIPSALGAAGIVDIDFDLPARLPPVPPTAAAAAPPAPAPPAFASAIPRAFDKRAAEPAPQSTTPRHSPPRKLPVLHGRTEKHDRPERQTPVRAKAAPVPTEDADVDMADDEDDEDDEFEVRSRAPSNMHMLSASTATQGNILGSASLMASKKLGIKPAVGQVKSLQLASSALKKSAAERKTQLAKQNEARRAEAARRKAEEDRVAAEEEKRRAAREDAERRKRMADALAKKKEREEQVAKALKAKQLKDEKEAAAKRAAEEEAARRREDELRKRKAQQPLNRSASAMSLAASQAGPMKKIVPQPKQKEPFRPGPAKMGPNVFRVADTAATSTIRPVGLPARPSHMQPAAAARPAGAAASNPAAGASVLQQSRAALVHQLEAPEVVSEDIVLPDIASEYSDSDDSDRETDFKRPAWAESPELRSALEAQATVNPDDLFGAVRPLNMEELFKQRSEKFRKRTSSANWSGADRLTEAEEREYARRMGFRNAPGGAGPSGLRKESTDR